MPRTDEQDTPRRDAIDVLVVPLDGSEEATVAVPVAVRLAAAIGAGLQLLSAVDDEDEVSERRSLLDEVRVDGVEVDRSVVVEADPVVALTRAGREPGRHLCMATMGRGRTAGVVGSVVLSAVRTLGQPILCVGPRLGATTSTAPSAGVIVCLDGSPHSEAALEPAARWAAALGEPLTLATAVEDAPSTQSGRPPRGSFGVEDPDGYLTSQAAKVQDRVVSVDMRVLTDPLGPGGALQSFMSREAAVIVAAGTRGRSGLARTVLGSVASDIVRHSAAPVLLVPSQP